MCLSGGLVTSLKPVRATNALFVFCCFTGHPTHKLTKHCCWCYTVELARGVGHQSCLCITCICKPVQIHDKKKSPVSNMYSDGCIFSDTDECFLCKVVFFFKMRTSDMQHVCSAFLLEGTMKKFNLKSPSSKK